MYKLLYAFFNLATILIGQRGPELSPFRMRHLACTCHSVMSLVSSDRVPCLSPSGYFPSPREVDYGAEILLTSETTRLHPVFSPAHCRTILQTSHLKDCDAQHQGRYKRPPRSQHFSFSPNAGQARFDVQKYGRCLGRTPRGLTHEAAKNSLSPACRL